jgi:glycosyltransferase involved in cell wall biosynthesis
MLYFRGCTAREKQTGISMATEKLLNLAGVNYHILDDEKCCGSVLLRTGFEKEAREQMEKNTEILRDEKIVTSCVGCYKTFKEDYEGLDVIHISQLLDGLIKENKQLHLFGDNALLKCFDYCICHNFKMKEYMISQGFEADRIIELGIFDYLTNEEMTAQAGETVSIAIAGNLAPGKCGYIYKICEGGQNKDLKVYLYGNRFDEEKASENMLYRGSFKPEELISHLNGSFGLVWDGPEIDGCKGNTGEYLRYNNPHKTSLYLAAGMPVIVWDEAAVSAFVKENKVGLLVPGLSDVAERIKEVSDEEYALMRENARNIGKKLRKGGFFYAAFDECLKRAGL